MKLEIKSNIQRPEWKIVILPFILQCSYTTLPCRYLFTNPWNFSKAKIVEQLLVIKWKCQLYGNLFLNRNSVFGHIYGVQWPVK